jgi:hypothetical protein
MRKTLIKVALGVTGLAALALGGSALAGAAGTETGTTSSSTQAPSPANGAGGFTAADAPGTAAHENAEKAVTGADAEKAQAAAVASISGGGKTGAVTTDFFGRGYEVTVTKSDGSSVTVHLDSQFKVQDHPGPGSGPGGGRMPPGGQSGYGAGQGYGQPPAA